VHANKDGKNTDFPTSNKRYEDECLKNKNLSVPITLVSRPI